jgi:hypothetical protein
MTTAPTHPDRGLPRSGRGLSVLADSETFGRPAQTTHHGSRGDSLLLTGSGPQDLVRPATGRTDRP